jgi:hypothetical protein
LLEEYLDQAAQMMPYYSIVIIEEAFFSILLNLQEDHRLSHSHQALVHFACFNSQLDAGEPAALNNPGSRGC